MKLSDLPTLNAGLNALSALFMILGWVMIRRERKFQHILCMAAAFLSSTLFLASYTTYHLMAPGVTRFTGTGAIRGVYFALLLSHTVLAAIVLPLVVLTVIPALRARWGRHRRLGRWTLPIWLYVSLTGILVYLMLYRWFPPAPSGLR